MPNNSEKTGVLLMTYGSATQANGVKAYMEHIYHGKASGELITDFEHRYQFVGGSPLVQITKNQAQTVEILLNREQPGRYLVRAAMLHSEPFIDQVVLELKNAGATKLKGIILSPQFSSFIMDGYSNALKRAAEQHGFTESDISVAGSWPTEPNFIKLLSQRVHAGLTELETKFRQKIPVLFTTHSLPERVVAKDPNYLTELRQTIDATLAELNEPNLEWHACYQSAGHTPEAWLKPDLTDVLAALGQKHVPAVLIVPIQFLADHLEILYDLDVAAKEQCVEAGIEYHRIELPNTDPLLIKALAHLAP